MAKATRRNTDDNPILAEAQDRTLTVTFLADKSGAKLRAQDLTLEQLRDCILTTNAAEKGSLPWLKLASFGSKRTKKGSLRHDQNVLQISGVEVDYDGEAISVDTVIAVVTAARLRALVYTSPSHSVERPRWRILLPTSQPLAPAERAKLVARVNGLFEGQLAPESFTLSQGYFYGSINGSADHRAVIVDGDCIDQRDDLDAGAHGRHANGKGGDVAVRGYDGHIALLGDGEGLGGFNGPLCSASAAYVHQHGKDFDRDELKTMLRAAIERAPKKSGRDDDIARYLSDGYLDDLIASAGEKFGGKSEKEQLARLNAEYCVIQDGGKVRVLRFDETEEIKDGRVVHRRLVPTYFGFGDFHNYFKNEKVQAIGDNGKPKSVPLGNWWTSHPQRRTYKGLTFRPDVPKQEVIDGRLNLWRGWGVEPKPGDWSLMRQHIQEVLAAGDDEADTYIVNFCAWAIQHPAEPAEAALVLKGGRGTGKGTLGNTLVRLFGQHAMHISSVKHLVGHFNAHLRDCCLLFADEAYWPGDKADEGQLKRLITEPTLAIEPKFFDVMTVTNMLHVIMASNEDWTVPAGEHERRYAVFQVSEDKRQDEAWFKPLYTQLTNGGDAAMLHDLLGYDLGDWHPRKVPMTEALREEQLRSLQPLDAWIVGLLEEGRLPGGEKGFAANQARSRSPDIVMEKMGLFDVARSKVPKLRHADDQVLANHLKKIGCEPVRSSAADRARGWEFPPLAECRARWEQKFPGWRWQHPELTEWQTGDADSF